MRQDVDTAVILAAGMGSRMHATSTPKPLMKLAGRHIIEYPITSLCKAGIRHLVVVTGFQARVLEAGIAALALPPGCSVETVYNPRWKEANGLSLAAAGLAVQGENFVLSMSDHVYAPALVTALIESGIPDGVKLCVDTNIDGVFDLGDATKVLVRDGRIVDIGKKINEYNGIDMGLFLCGPAVFPALQQAFDQGRTSLSDGMNILGRRGGFQAFDATGFYWQDVDDPAMFAKAEADIRRLGLGDA